jgi:CRISPR-associated protein Cas6/Cse3/CasE, subtype I-E/ECOLI
MYLSRIELREEAGRSPEFWKNLATVKNVHRIVWSFFGDEPDRARDFLFRHEGEGLTTRLYTLSARAPVDSSGMWEIATKDFAPKLAPGDRLMFALRANPTRRKKNGDASGKRVDVVMDAKFAARANGTRQQGTDLIEAACVEWLRSRSEGHGFEFGEGDVRTERYTTERFPRGRGERDAAVTTIDFEGRLTVRDPSRLVESVVQGIGPGKAFGCGLMLIKRA